MENNPTPTTRRKTIAFLVRNLTTGVGIRIWDGICRAVEQKNVNLITLLGNKLDGQPANSIYDMVRKKTVDGIIAWASSDLDEYANYYENYAGIPFLTLTSAYLRRIDFYTGARD